MTVLTRFEPYREFANPSFQLKMLLIVGIVFLTWFFQSPLNRDPNYWSATRGRRVAANAIAVISLILVVAILFAGRWIAYTITPD